MCCKTCHYVEFSIAISLRRAKLKLYADQSLHNRLYKSAPRKAPGSSYRANRTLPLPLYSVNTRLRLKLGIHTGTQYKACQWREVGFLGPVASTSLELSFASQLLDKGGVSLGPMSDNVGVTKHYASALLTFFSPSAGYA